jgi:hypothetical protein
VAILMSSGIDWTARTGRMAARAPDLNIFGQSLVLRDSKGWQITEAGRTLLASLEGSAMSKPWDEHEAPPDASAIPSLPTPITPPGRLIAVERRHLRRRVRTRPRSSAVA